jgi:high frequency lysogenization protein
MTDSNFSKEQEKTIALAGILQSCYLVDRIAQTGQCDQATLTVLMESVLQTDPASTLDVYKDLTHLKEGLALLNQLLNTGSQTRSHTVRYALAIMHLQRKLNKRSDFLQEISKRLSSAQVQVQHFGAAHENVIFNLAGIYSDTVSTFAMRIQVAGHAQHLQVDLNAAKIRALFLAAIRSSMLWRQLGGHRWQFIVNKRKLVTTSQSLLDRLN